MTLQLPSVGDQPKQGAPTVRWLRVTRNKWKITVSVENPTEERRALIAKLAYRFYEQRGRQDGHALDDWLKAERQLFNEDLRERFSAVDQLVHASLSEEGRHHKRGHT